MRWHRREERRPIQTVEPRTRQSAAAELDASERQFLVYLDKETDQIQVLYRREDESLGIIHPHRRAKR